MSDVFDNTFCWNFLQARFPGPPVQDLSAPQQASISQLRAKETVPMDRTDTASSSA